MAKATTPVEPSIEPDATAPEAPAVEPSIEPEATAPEATAVGPSIEPEAPFPDPVAGADEGALTPKGLVKLVQLIGMIEASRFAPFEEFARALRESEGMTLDEDGPHTICTMAGVTAICAGDGRAAVITWANAARRYLLQAEA